MKWVGDTEPPQICAEIRSYDKKVTETYCVLDLPAMVITAEDEQVLDVLLEYDPPEDEFDLLGDEEAERRTARLAKADSKKRKRLEAAGIDYAFDGYDTTAAKAAKQPKSIKEKK